MTLDIDNIKQNQF